MSRFAEAYAKAWCSREPESVASFFAENGSLQVNDGEPAVGRSAIAAVVRNFMTAFPDMVVTMDRFYPRPEGGADFHWTLTGTNTAIGGTGRSVCISGFEEWTFDENDLIARSLGHFDAAEYQRQLREGV